MELTIIQAFFENYRSLDNKLQTSRIQGEITQFQEFQKRYKPFDERMHELLSRETPHYNVFSILNVSHRETKLHTPFLVNLLNPLGSHEQGTLFFNEFLKVCLGWSSQISEIRNIQIHEEYAHDNGQIDILILFRINEIQHAFVIENKVYAADQKDQLMRYHTFLLKNMRLAPEHIWLLYLTPSGREPFPSSMPLDIQIEMRQNGHLIEIGYRSHIICWLNECLPLVKSDLVKSTIVQYVKTLEFL